MGFIAVLEEAFERNRDKRIAHWTLSRSPEVPLVIVPLYLTTVLWLGPRLMRDRKPMNLTRVIMVYNIVQVVFNAMMFVKLLDAGWLGKYSFVCEPVDYSNTPEAMKMAEVGWWYYLFKLVDLLDTIFFVLRKKFNQITFLHVYHHTMMVLYLFVGLNIWPGGHGSFFALCNTFVHVVMYGYYFLAGLGPQVQKYLWWKKYVTRIQLTQFLLVFGHSMQLLWNDCGYPRQLAFLIIFNALIFIALFTAFYRKAYGDGARSPAHPKAAKAA